MGWHLYSWSKASITRPGLASFMMTHFPHLPLQLEEAKSKLAAAAQTSAQEAEDLRIANEARLTALELQLAAERGVKDAIEAEKGRQVG